MNGIGGITYAGDTIGGLAVKVSDNGSTGG